MKNPLIAVLLVTMVLLAGCAPVRTPVNAMAEPTATTSAAPAPIACSGVLTPPNMEGPYYSPGSPQRDNLIDEGMPGVPLLITGRVFDQDCNPFAGAKLDFWQADANGAYDNAGYTLRGHVFSDADGSYAIESIEPGEYPGRPPHIHVKVFDPDGRELLTTQLYTVGSENSADVRNAPGLLAPYVAPDATDRKQVLFNFVVSR